MYLACLCNQEQGGDLWRRKGEGDREEEKNNGGDRKMNEEERGNCYFCWYAFDRGRGDYVD